ncbi:unannotated protein [freshwater metagenome]|uniref:Unannotated protein n=1 Tax=freshwater metagenome TaxID=449393 RepID=A0A6J7GJB2_9ZZZZ
MKPHGETDFCGRIPPGCPVGLRALLASNSESGTNDENHQKNIEEVLPAKPRRDSPGSITGEVGGSGIVKDKHRHARDSDDEPGRHDDDGGRNDDETAAQENLADSGKTSDAFPQWRAHAHSRHGVFRLGSPRAVERLTNYSRRCVNEIRRMWFSKRARFEIGLGRGRSFAGPGRTAGNARQSAAKAQSRLGSLTGYRRDVTRRDSGLCWGSGHRFVVPRGRGVSG